jgi:cytochrome c biogenesis protein CcmG, thiol:disulfide interchange protein DsbE
MKAGIRNLLFILPVLLFMTLAAYFALALRSGDDPRELPSALLNQEAPPFSLPGLNGDGIARDTLKGEPVLINFFASWCLPCRIEHPLLMRLAEHDHVKVYGIDYKDPPEDAVKLLAQFGDPYRAVGVDRDGRAGLDFGVYGVPETYVLDKSGHIRKRFVGPLTAQQVDKELLPLLRQLGLP